MATTKSKLKTSGLDLIEHLSCTVYPDHVLEIAGSVLSGIEAAQIGARVHPSTKARLLEDVAKMEQALTDAR